MTNFESLVWLFLSSFLGPWTFWTQTRREGKERDRAGGGESFQMSSKDMTGKQKGEGEMK